MYRLLLLALMGCGPADEKKNEGDGPPEVGPENGTLIVNGGNGGDAFGDFVDRVGADRPIVWIPTGLNDDDPWMEPNYREGIASDHGLTDFTMVHTRDPAEADTKAFTAAIERAEGVWFEGGRTQRILQVYLDTRSEDALRDLLDRGGVIGGTSAAAQMQGSFPTRTSGITPDVIIGPLTEGFGFLRNAAVDSHVGERGRELEMLQVLEEVPGILGLGLDEQTYFVVEGDRAEVFGAAQAYVYDEASWPGGLVLPEERYFTLQAGDVLDLASRKIVP